MRITIQIDAREALAALGRLERALGDLRSPLREIAGALESSVEDAFALERAPSGEAWAPLRPVTQRRRRAWPGMILQDSAHLAGSITSSSGADWAAAGTNLGYAPTHQFGARKGQFGRTRRGAPIPWGDVPARPFLGRADELDGEILDVVERWLRRAVAGS